MVEYKLNKKTVYDTDTKSRIAYGISVCSGSTDIRTISDISDDKLAVEKLIKDFNDYELDICHLEQAIEDFLYNLESD